MDYETQAGCSVIARAVGSVILVVLCVAGSAFAIAAAWRFAVGGCA